MSKHTVYYSILYISATERAHLFFDWLVAVIPVSVGTEQTTDQLAPNLTVSKNIFPIPVGFVLFQGCLKEQYLNARDRVVNDPASRFLDPGFKSGP